MGRLGLAMLMLALCAVAAVAHIPEGRQETELHPPKDGSTPESWCAAHMARGELVQAYFDCEKAVSDNPTSARAFSNRGSLFLLTNAPERAVADFDLALKLQPDDASLLFNRGLAHARLGRSNDAIADYTHATRLDPKLAIAYHNRGREHEILGNLDEAILDYKAALEIAPDLTPSRQALERLDAKEPGETK
jgi:tetratricopeptide (TPR) repeat protein